MMMRRRTCVKVRLYKCESVPVQACSALCSRSLLLLLFLSLFEKLIKLKYENQKVS